MTRDDYQATLEEIVAAFPPRDVAPTDILVQRFGVDYESTRLDEALRSAKNWQALTFDHFRTGYHINPTIALFLMTAESACHFIAWFLTSTLTSPVEADVVVDGVVSFLTSPRESSEGLLSLSDFMSVLSARQLRAIALYLSYLRQHDDNWSMVPAQETGFQENWAHLLLEKIGSQLPPGSDTH